VFTQDKYKYIECCSEVTIPTLRVSFEQFHQTGSMIDIEIEGRYSITKSNMTVKAFIEVE
jgi:hypothetical protein